MSDLISRREMLRTYQELCMNISCSECSFYFGNVLTGDCLLEKWIHSLPSAEPKTPSNGSITSINPENTHDRTMGDCISRQDAIDAIFSEPLYESGMKKRDADAVVPAIYEKIKSLPSVEKTQLSGEDATKGELSELVRKKKVYNAVSNAIAPYIPLLNGKTEEIPLKCARAIMWLPPEQPPKCCGYSIDYLVKFATACRVEGIEEEDLRNFVLNMDHIYRMIEKSVRKSLNTFNTLGALDEALSIGGDEK